MSEAPTSCAHCGAPLSSGRFCTNCGAQIGSTPLTPREPAAEPSYAEPVHDQTAERRYPRPTYTEPTSAPVYAEPASYDEPQRQGTAGPGLWLGAAAVLLVILLIGGWLALHGTGGGTATDSSPHLLPKPSPASGSASPTSATSSTPSSSATPSTTASPHGAAGEVAGFAQASAPAHAPAAVDFAGNPVTYVAANLVDGDPQTCWREPGDGTGTVLTLRLARPTQVTKVGLVNGYAKTAYAGGRAYDWYAGNRRVISVEWLFDDGSSVSQTFGQSRTMQELAITPVTTSTVRIQITAVSPPGTGRAARDDTAISEVSVVGRAS